MHPSAWKGNSQKMVCRMPYSPARLLPYGRPEISRLLKVDHYMLHLRIMMRSGGCAASSQNTDADRGGEKAGRSPVDRGKRGIKRSMAVDASGIPLGAVSAPANRHDSPLLVPTLEAASEALGAMPEGASVHLDRGATTRVSPASVWR